MPKRVKAAAAADAWKSQLEEVLRRIPGYNPWDQAPAGGEYWLDHESALRAINFFADHLKHVEGAARGEPFILRPWQAAIVGNLFGWKRKDEKGRTVRRYRKCLAYVPRGNGKTPLAAGIVLLAFLEDGEPGAQNYLAAGQKEQAGILFRNAVGMVDQAPELLARLNIYRGAAHRSMVLKDDTLSFCKTIPADAAGQHGGIPHITVVDELHVQDTRDLLDVFETGMSKQVRAQPLLVMITTADYDRESICNEVYAHACRVRDNKGDRDQPGHDPSFLPVIYESIGDDWTSEEAFRAANPNLGVSVTLSSLKEACKKAQENPAFENAFRRLHLNQKTKQEFRLVPIQSWDGCGQSGAPRLEDLAGRECFGGLDLSSTDDLSAFDLVFPMPDDWLAVLSFAWCPAERITRRARQKYPYDVWSRRGYGPDGLPNFLSGTEGDWIDYAVIQRDILELNRRYSIREIGYDPHGASQIMQNLIAEGLTVVPITQSFRNLSAPTKELLRRVKMKKIAHFGNPVLRWAVGNAAAHFDGKLPEGGKIDDHLDKVPVMLSKRKSADKIDPAAALVLALARMGEHPADETSSVYDTRGILEIDW